jgi:thioredoxin-related protein
MKKLILLASLLLVTSNVWSADEYLPYDESANAEIELANAITEASKENKHVLIEMGANWCPDCRTLGKYFQREDIKAWLDKHFIVVTVDIGNWDKNLEIVERYGNPISEGIPSLVVLDSKGKMQFVTLGGELATAREMSGDDLIGWLKEHIQPILD